MSCYLRELRRQRRPPRFAHPRPPLSFPGKTDRFVRPTTSSVERSPRALAPASLAEASDGMGSAAPSGGAPDSAVVYPTGDPIAPPHPTGGGSPTGSAGWASSTAGRTQARRTRTASGATGSAGASGTRTGVRAGGADKGCQRDLATVRFLERAAFSNGLAHPLLAAASRSTRSSWTPPTPSFSLCSAPPASLSAARAATTPITTWVGRRTTTGSATPAIPMPKTPGPTHRIRGRSAPPASVEAAATLGSPAQAQWRTPSISPGASWASDAEREPTRRPPREHPTPPSSSRPGWTLFER